MSSATTHPDRRAPGGPTDGAPASAVTVPFTAIVLAMIPAVLDQTILATGLPVIASDLGSLRDVSWVVTAYVVAAAATTPLWGKLGDRYGRKMLLEVSLALFVVTSALCGAAQDITQLIALRLVQGAAAGGLMTLAMAAVGDLVVPRERGRYRRRPAARGRARRARELALGLPRQPAGRRRRSGWSPSAPAEPPYRAAEASSRRLGRGVAVGRHQRADADLYLLAAQEGLRRRHHHRSGRAPRRSRAPQSLPGCAYGSAP